MGIRESIIKIQIAKTNLWESVVNKIKRSEVADFMFRRFVLQGRTG